MKTRQDKVGKDSSKTERDQRQARRDQQRESSQALSTGTEGRESGGSKGGHRGRREERRKVTTQQAQTFHVHRNRKLHRQAKPGVPERNKTRIIWDRILIQKVQVQPTT